MRCHRHVLGAPREDELGLAELDLLRRENDRLQAGPAETVDGEGRCLLRYARLEAYVSREVNRIARGLKDVAEDDLVDLLRIDLGLFERALRGDDAEVGRGGVPQRTAVRPECGARAVDDDD